MTWRAWWFRSWRKAVPALLGLAAIAVVAWHYRGRIDWSTIVAEGRRVPAGWFIAAFLVLPVVGFPISVLLLLAGARFGIAGGMLLATVGIYVHHLAVYRLAQGWLRARLAVRLERAGLAIPHVAPSHRYWFTALFAAIQGPPYAFKLYLLALTDIPLRVHLLAGAPVYAAFCLAPISAGSAAFAITSRRIYLTVGLIAGFMLLGRFLRKRFGRDLKQGAGEEPP